MEYPDAGRELDALVAEHVMGWAPIKVINGRPIAEGWTGFYDGKWLVWTERPEPTEEGESHPWRPSTDIAAAWQVVEKMQQHGFWCQMRTPFDVPGGKWYDKYWAGFTPHGMSGWNGTPDNWTQADTLLIAICHAALEALEVTV